MILWIYALNTIKINELYMAKKMENGNTISIFFNKGERGIK